MKIKINKINNKSYLAAAYASALSVTIAQTVISFSFKSVSIDSIFSITLIWVSRSVLISTAFQTYGFPSEDIKTAPNSYSFLTLVHPSKVKVTPTGSSLRAISITSSTFLQLYLKYFLQVHGD